jgi:hypothetical protein
MNITKKETIEDRIKGTLESQIEELTGVKI